MTNGCTFRFHRYDTQAVDPPGYTVLRGRLRSKPAPHSPNVAATQLSLHHRDQDRTGKAVEPHKPIQPEKTPDTDERIPTAEGIGRQPCGCRTPPTSAPSSPRPPPRTSRPPSRRPPGPPGARPGPRRCDCGCARSPPPAPRVLRPHLPPRPPRASHRRAPLPPPPRLQPPATASRGRRSPRYARPTSCTMRQCRAPSGGSRSGATVRRPRCVLLVVVVQGTLSYD